MFTTYLMMILMWFDKLAESIVSPTKVSIWEWLKMRLLPILFETLMEISVWKRHQNTFRNTEPRQNPWQSQEAQSHWIWWLISKDGWMKWRNKPGRSTTRSRSGIGKKDLRLRRIAKMSDQMRETSRPCLWRSWPKWESPRIISIWMIHSNFLMAMQYNKLAAIRYLDWPYHLKIAMMFRLRYQEMRSRAGWLAREQLLGCWEAQGLKICTWPMQYSSWSWFRDRWIQPFQ